MKGVVRRKILKHHVEKVCVCLSPWMEEMVVASRAVKCVYCNTEFDLSTPFEWYCFLIPCSRRIKLDDQSKAHVYSIRFHANSGCFELFCKKLKSESKFHLIDLYPLRMENAPKNIQAARIASCLEKHTFSSTHCSACGTLSQRNWPMPKCLGCKSVSYCNEACQRKDWWYKHKEVCGKTDPPARNNYDACSCLNEYEYIKHINGINKVCSNTTCNVAVKPGSRIFSHGAAYVSTCRNSVDADGRAIPHIFPERYCSKKCRQTDMKQSRNGEINIL